MRTLIFVTGLGMSVSASAAMWKCPGTPPTYEFDLVPAQAIPRGCVALTHDEAAPAAPAVPEQAPPNWKYLVNDADGCEYYLDPSTYSTRGPYRKAWFMWNCAGTKIPKDVYGVVTKSTKFLMYFNCAEQTSATIQSVPYTGPYGSGATAQGYVYAVEKATFTEPAPGTIGASWLASICRGKPPAK
jgi:hypothetical protein